jgi:hypothetical protein
MNGAQLRKIDSVYSDLMSGPPADLGRRPAHRDKAAMNGAQLRKIDIVYSDLMSGPLAASFLAKQAPGEGPRL